MFTYRKVYRSVLINTVAFTVGTREDENTNTAYVHVGRKAGKRI